MKCVVCHAPLETTPRLGEWIMHPSCQEYVKMAYSEGAKAERLKIIAWLRKRTGAVTGWNEVHRGILDGIARMLEQEKHE